MITSVAKSTSPLDETDVSSAQTARQENLRVAAEASGAEHIVQDLHRLFSILPPTTALAQDAPHSLRSPNLDEIFIPVRLDLTNAASWCVDASASYLVVSGTPGIVVAMLVIKHATTSEVAARTIMLTVPSVVIGTFYIANLSLNWSGVLPRGSYNVEVETQLYGGQGTAVINLTGFAVVQYA